MVKVGINLVEEWCNACSKFRKKHRFENDESMKYKATSMVNATNELGINYAL